ncbi:MAG: hypothetical protein ACTS5I_10545 [Rhodanobacter sp.]
MAAIQQIMLAQGSSGGSVTYATWNPSDKGANITLSGGNLIADGTVFAGEMVRATVAIVGKRYFECSFYPTADGTGVGVAPLGDTLGNYIGSGDGYGHYLPGNDVYQHGGIVFLGATRSVSPAVIGIAIDGLKMWVRVSGQAGFEGGGDPAAGTSPTVTMSGVTANTLRPACTPYTGTAGQITLNCGQSAFTLWTPSGGFSGVS